MLQKYNQFFNALRGSAGRKAINHPSELAHREFVI